MCPKFQGPRWRTFRVCTFVGIGLSELAPFIHGIKLFGFEQMKTQSGILYYLLEGLFLILGAIFYTARCAVLSIYNLIKFIIIIQCSIFELNS